MKIELWPIDQVIPYARNARTITAAAVDKVAASIQEFGWRQPIVVDAHRVIIAGHTRLLAARKLGFKEVPVHVADNLTPAQVKAYRLMDNRSHDETSWDFELLGPELLDLQNLGFGNLELTGFDEKEIADFLAGAASPGQEGLTPDDEAPALREAPVAQPGELWRLGDHRLLCGDAMILADVQRVLAGARADLVIIDPPYNVDYEGATKEKLKIKNDRMADSLFFSFLLKAYQNLVSVTKEGAGIYVFHADTEGANFRRALVEAGWKLAQCCVWVKQTLVMGRQDYQAQPVGRRSCATQGATNMSQKQIEANRGNAQKSTGPRTREGEAKSAQNATTHGFAGLHSNPLAPGCFLRVEDERQFFSLPNEYVKTYNPQHPDELDLLAEAVFAKLMSKQNLDGRNRSNQNRHRPK